MQLSLHRRHEDVSSDGRQTSDKQLRLNLYSGWVSMMVLPPSLVPSNASSPDPYCRGGGSGPGVGRNLRHI